MFPKVLLYFDAKRSSGSEKAAVHGAALSAGSFGHPDLCRRPCLLFMKNICRIFGKEEEFCIRLPFLWPSKNDTQLCLGIRRRQTSTDVVRTMKLSMAGVSEAPKSIDAVEERLDLWLLSLAT